LANVNTTTDPRVNLALLDSKMHHYASQKVPVSYSNLFYDNSDYFISRSRYFEQRIIEKHWWERINTLNQVVYKDEKMSERYNERNRAICRSGILPAEWVFIMMEKWQCDALNHWRTGIKDSVVDWYFDYVLVSKDDTLFTLARHKQKLGRIKEFVEALATPSESLI
jgi:hypothetical protein